MPLHCLAAVTPSTFYIVPEPQQLYRIERLHLQAHPVTASEVWQTIKILQTDRQCLPFACCYLNEIKEHEMGGACSMTVQCEVHAENLDKTETVNVG